MTPSEPGTSSQKPGSTSDTVGGALPTHCPAYAVSSIHGRNDVGEPVGARRLFHDPAHHGYEVIRGGHGAAERGHELACSRGALLLLGWHGRRLLPGVP